MISLDTNVLVRYLAQDDAKQLPPAEGRFLQQTLDDFKRHGAELSPANKQRLSAISVQLSQLTTQYSQNVLDASGAYQLIVTDGARLAGLPEGI